MPNTIGDFWRMVWQENVTSIVMVTTLVEGEKVCGSARIGVCRIEHHYCKGCQRFKQYRHVVNH